MRRARWWRRKRTHTRPTGTKTSELACHASLSQRLVLLLGERDRIPRRGGILDRHRGHLVEALAVDADVRQGVRDPDLLPERQDPVEEAIEPPLDAEVGSGALDVLLDLLPVRLDDVRHDDAVERAVVRV